MTFFSKKPIRRPRCVVVYVSFAVWLIIDSFAWLNVLVSIVALFGGYIALVKSKIIKDKNANAIDDYKFDLFSILSIVVLIIEIIF